MLPAQTPLADSFDLMKEKDFCEETGTPERTAQRWRATGEGPEWIRFGKRQVRYRRASVHEWLRRNTFQSRAAEISKKAA